MSVREGISGVGTRVAAVVLVGIGLAAVTLLGLRRRPEEPVSPPPGEEPIIEEPVSIVIRQFSQSVAIGQAILTVGFVVDPVDPRSSIKWNFGDGSPEVLDQLVVNHSYDRVGDFNGFVEVIDSIGNSDRVNFSVSVSAPALPPPGQRDIITNFVQTQSVIFVGGEVGFSIALGVQTQLITWEFGDGTNRVLNQTTVDHRYNEAGTFEGFVEVLDLEGNREVIPFTVLVQLSQFEISVSIDVGPEPGLILEPGEVIPFRAQLGGGTAPFVNLEWDFGDGTIISGPETFVSHIYQTVGNFTVSLRVTDSVGETAFATKGVIIRSAPLAFGDVVVTIEPIQVTFDWRIRLQNVRRDLSIDGELILRILDAPGFGSRVHLSRRTGFFLSPGETESDFLINPSDLPVNQPLLLVAEFQERSTQKLLGDASEQFSVSAPDQPPAPPPDEPPVPPPEPMNVIKEFDFKTENVSFQIPIFQRVRTLPVQFRLPGSALRVQFARVFVKLRIDFFTDADAKIIFNDQELDTIQFRIGEANVFKQRDIVVTGLVRLNNELNDLVIEFNTANFLFPAEAFIELASVFVEWEEPG